ncbi:L-tryptophan decarboxylase [Fulvia fulva]|uniref:L-tryptophan decarboxylase n=1 Tax=Passalora fulva TaxID=5499 RepID=A0A9Q8L9K7_PASFU|nr:L-tryptophan decarboxylase [Fulvia fulva]KAK4631844.1 L-tryptophan decarboxylase [Fulvia fulva]KAK4633677.1 L-tryptophan decarboxylase [Fulvia fulva]UJO13286.1 L-tryptophan decarboxylase [Fulvia fulva]WPV10486.1 L-tryptophan decarboxylase [Fulvia fulva]WPV26567.1 L-tryptophan decarboxylase [Fulvia fulva]
MFEEVPQYTPYKQDPTGAPTLRSFDEMLLVLDHILREGPPFYDRKRPTTAMGLVGTPINAILNWPIATLSGHQFFLSPIVNAELKQVLDTWAKFLGTSESQACLGGWLSSEGREAIAQAGNDGKTNYTFEQLFQYPNASAPYLGYTSWDSYFVRKFQDGIRPVEAPDNGPLDPRYPDPTAVVTNACESAPLQVQSGVQLFDTFYLKNQPYSLTNMLNFSPLAHQFVNGTVYQAYLSALSYHRWHAPVSGRVLKIENVPGTYYSSNLYTGFFASNGSAPDPAAPNESQPYISAVATRGIIYIQANNPKIGVMATVFIGMAEVSSCEFTVEEGDMLEKGDEIGMFHYGGSSHVMVFRPGVELRFVNPGPWSIEAEENFPVRSALAAVS